MQWSGTHPKYFVTEKPAPLPPDLPRERSASKGIGFPDGRAPAHKATHRKARPQTAVRLRTQGPTSGRSKRATAKPRKHQEVLR